MSDLTNSVGDSDSNYFLDEQERWEALGFDWQDWNLTVAKIIQQQALVVPSEQD